MAGKNVSMALHHNYLLKRQEAESRVKTEQNKINRDQESRLDPFRLDNEKADGTQYRLM